MTHAERRERRHDIAMLAKMRGDDALTLATNYGLSVKQVQNACKEFGVPVPSPPPKENPDAPGTLGILRALLDYPGMTLSDLAAMLGVSVQRVSKVRQDALSLDLLDG